MEKFKKWLKKRLSGDQGYRILHLISRNPVLSFFIGVFFGRNLTKLAIINNTDKHRVGRHEYMEHYQRHFSKLKYKKNNLLEIGVGGYKRPDRGGCSLRMWKQYFPFGHIYALDIYDKRPQEERRIKIFKGSQIDYNFLDDILDSIGNSIDIIIDDGSHINEHVIGSFQYLFPKLKEGGIYVVEDVQTSYREDYGGSSTNLEEAYTMMNFFKKILDFINHDHFSPLINEDNVHYKMISSIHFYDNLIFIHKK